MVRLDSLLATINGSKEVTNDRHLYKFYESPSLHPSDISCGHEHRSAEISLFRIIRLEIALSLRSSQ